MADGPAYVSFMNTRYPVYESNISCNKISKQEKGFQTTTKDAYIPPIPPWSIVSNPLFGIPSTFCINRTPLWLPSYFLPYNNFFSPAPTLRHNVDHEKLKYWQHLLTASLLTTPVTIAPSSRAKERPLVQQFPKHQCTGCGLYFKYLANLRAHKEYYCIKCNANLVGDTPIKVFARTKHTLKVLAQGDVNIQKTSPCNSLDNTGIKQKILKPSQSTSSQNRETTQFKSSSIHRSKRIQRNSKDQDGTFCAICNIKFIKRTSYEAHKHYYCPSKNLT